MLRTALRRAGAAAPRSTQNRTLAAEASITIDFPGAYTAHLAEEPAATAQTSKSELLEYFKTMYTMRRMEIATDVLYKGKFVAGLCRLDAPFRRRATSLFEQRRLFLSRLLPPLRRPGGRGDGARGARVFLFPGSCPSPSARAGRFFLSGGGDHDRLDRHVVPRSLLPVHARLDGDGGARRAAGQVYRARQGQGGIDAHVQG